MANNKNKDDKLKYIEMMHLSCRNQITLGVLFVLAALGLFKPWVHGADGMGYYSWLRSVVLDGDLDTANEYEYFGYAWIAGTTATGLKDNPWAIGSAVLWSPFFLITHAILRGDGYGPAYFTAISMASMLYAFAGLVLLYRLAERLFDPDSALLATTLVWFGSSLVFYMYMHPSMAHANDAFVNALFVYVWYWTRPERTLWGWLILGLTTGLAALVRTQNLLLMVVPVVEILLALNKNRSGLLAQLLKGLVFGIGLLLAFFPQMYVWRQVYGSWIVPNPYWTSTGNTFNPASPNFLKVLFSSHHGLFTWTPALLFGIAGLLPLARRDQGLAILLGVGFLLQVYIIGGWSAWAGGAAFGQRFLINNTPSYLLGMTAFIDSMRKRMNLRALWAIGIMLVLWNMGLIAQYVTEMIPHEAPVSLVTIAINQLRLPIVLASRLGDLMTKRLVIWK